MTYLFPRQAATKERLRGGGECVHLVAGVFFRQAQPTRKNREEHLNEKLHGYDHACASDGSANLRHYGSSSIGESQVAKWRGSIEFSGVRRTFCDFRLLRGEKTGRQGDRDGKYDR